MADIDKILEDLDKLVNAKSKEAIENLQKQIEEAIKNAGQNLKSNKEPNEEQDNTEAK